MKVRGSSLFLLSGQRNHDASRSSHQNSVGSIIKTIRRLGWQQLYSKSMFTWSCDCWWYLMHCLDGSKSLTFKWSDKTSISACLLITSLLTASHIIYRTCISGPIWHHLCNHVTWESFDASRQYIAIIFACTRLTLMMLVNKTFINSTFSQVWQWQSKHGIPLHPRPSNIAGITPKSNCESIIWCSHFQCSIFHGNDPKAGLDSRPHVDAATWSIVCKFATTKMSLPVVKNDLKAHLHEHYVDSDWRPASWMPKVMQIWLWML